MKSRCEFASGPVVLALLLLPAPVFADESAPSSEFTYTDEWAVVSAPPPPGPYRAVNIDPRVPGVDAVPPLTIDAAAPTADSLIPPEAMANAPAAGIPAIRQPTDAPASALGTQRTEQPEMPGRTQRIAPPTPGYYYPAPSRYPAQSRPAAPAAAPPATYPGYRNQPGYGYYAAPSYRQGQHQVPPPPVYDSMMRNQYPGGKGTP